jgi:N4-gp56 family major capsid protein
MLKQFLGLFRKALADVTTRERVGASDYGTAVKFDQSTRKAYGIEVQFKALPLMRFFQFARVKDDLTKQPGQSIEVMLYNHLDLGGKLVEGTSMTTQTLSASLKDVRVFEYGKAISVSEFALQTSFRDIMDDAVRLLSYNFAMSMDVLLRDTALLGTQKIVSRSTNTIARIADPKTITNGTKSNYKFSTVAIDDSVEILGTANAPKIDGEYFISVIHPHQARDIKDDPKWEEWNKYTNAEAKFEGEIGKIESVRFIETTIMKQGANSGDAISYDATLVTTTDAIPLYQAVIFGEDYYALAMALYPELRDNGVEDFGRKHSIGWYGIFGSGILHEDRGVVITSV